MSHTRGFAYEANEGYSGVFGQLMVWCIKENMPARITVPSVSTTLCTLNNEFRSSLSKYKKRNNGSS